MYDVFKREEVNEMKILKGLSIISVSVMIILFIKRV